MGARVYSYIRFSDARQAAGHSSERQGEFAARWAAQHGLQLDDQLTMRDEGLSAYHQRHITQGALGVFLAAVQAGQVPPGSVLVVGVDSLLTQLARCCKPAPPDEIRGFVTRGKGVSIHRQDCSNLRELASRHAERVIDVRWGDHKGPDASVYPVDVAVEAIDRQGLLRDISEVFAKEKMNVIGVQTQSVKGTAWMTFTVEIGDAARLNKVLGTVRSVKGVRSARRR